VTGRCLPRYPAATTSVVLRGSIAVKHAPRLASPVGFGLALLLFLLLPFVAVSCDVPGLGSAELSYSGADVVGAAEPTVSTEGEFGSQDAAPVTDSENPPTPGTGSQVLAIITLVLFVGGLGVSLFPVARTRVPGAAGAALLGAVALIITQVVAQSNLSSAILDAAQREGAGRPDDNIPINLTSSLVDDMVQTRFGFWLSLLAVFLVLAYNGGLLLLPRLRARTAAAAGEPQLPPPAGPAEQPPPEPEPVPPFVAQAIERDTEERPPPQ
jgi:hypothetical protein